MDTGAWLAVIGGAALAGLAIWGLVVAIDNRDDIKSLKTNINTLTTCNQVALKNLSNVSAIGNTVIQLEAQASLMTSLAGQAQLALTVAGNAAAAAQAATISQNASASQSRLLTLQGQIQAAQSQIAAGGCNAAQLTTLLNAEEAERNTSNTLAAQLNALLAANRNTVGVPNTTVGAVGAPNVASVSLPA